MHSISAAALGKIHSNEARGDGGHITALFPEHQAADVILERPLGVPATYKKLDIIPAISSKSWGRCEYAARVTSTPPRRPTF